MLSGSNLPSRYRFIFILAATVLVFAVLRSVHGRASSIPPRSRAWPMQSARAAGPRTLGPHLRAQAHRTGRSRTGRGMVGPTTGKKTEAVQTNYVRNRSGGKKSRNSHAVEAAPDQDDWYENSPMAIPYRGDYHELFSITTRDRKFYPIHMDGLHTYNANLIPHPTRVDEWLVVASHPGEGRSEPLTCAAGNLNDVLVCSNAPQTLDTPPSIEGNCTGDLEYVNFYLGPRDPRVFYGLDTPYIMYGSQSSFTCIGVWMQDVRPLLEDFHISEGVGNKLFRTATELHRPPPAVAMERNYFVFWDGSGKAYVHYQVSPQRSFAQLDFDGSVGNELAHHVATHDKFCMAKYMPVPLSKFEAIEQTSNSLMITLCKRSDEKCKPDDQNTLIMHIFQHKTYYQNHNVYEPYVMLFNRTAPFGLYAIGQRPYWIHGRTNLTRATHAKAYEEDPESIPPNHSEMFYVNSMSWKRHGQHYHGFVDDPLWLSFGIEDSRAAAIDVEAGELIQDLAFC